VPNSPLRRARARPAFDNEMITARRLVLRLYIGRLLGVLTSPGRRPISGTEHPRPRWFTGRPATGSARCRSPRIISRAHRASPTTKSIRSHPHSAQLAFSVTKAGVLQHRSACAIVRLIRRWLR
jgi:hypothetical protein